MAIQSMFVLLSDLHFGRDLIEQEGELPLIAYSRLVPWQKAEATIREFFEGKCTGHNLACVKSLPRYLKFLLDKAGDEGYDKTYFDLYIILGDQVTIPDEKAYKFLCHYLTDYNYVTQDADSRYECRGLNIHNPAEMILAVPGNHDKLLRVNLDFYNEHFTKPLRLPYEIQRQRCCIITRNFNGREFVFLLIDAGAYAEHELVLDTGCREHLASGTVTEELCNDIREKLTALQFRYKSEGGKDRNRYETAIKILLVHYAIDFRRVLGSNAVDIANYILPHECKGIEELRQELAAKFGFGLALHGHLHVPALYAYKGTQTVADTTTTQYGGRNGFFVLKFFDTGEMRAEYHSWNGAAFAADPDRSLTQRLSFGAAA